MTDVEFDSMIGSVEVVFDMMTDVEFDSMIGSVEVVFVTIG